jgi:hypothetical protein
LEATNDSTIKEQLISILHDRYNTSLSSLGPEQWDIPLTSREIGLSGFALVQLFFEIEKIYGKTFEESILKDYGFSTINNIARAILSA